jgi:hypothetical protein
VGRLKAQEQPNPRDQCNSSIDSELFFGCRPNRIRVAEWTRAAQIEGDGEGPGGRPAAAPFRIGVRDEPRSL